MLTEQITEAFNNCMKLIAKYNPLVEKILVSPDKNRDTLLIAMIAIIESHTVSIHLLIKSGHPNSAYALFRPLFETTLKMRYMYSLMTDLQIKQFYDNPKNWEKSFKPLSLSKMAEEIDKQLSTDFFLPLTNGIKTTLHDYTHTGITQISSIFSPDGSVISVCKDQNKQLETMNIAQSLLKTSMTLYLTSIGVKNKFLESTEVEKIFL